MHALCELKGHPLLLLMKILAVKSCIHHILLPQVNMQEALKILMRIVVCYIASAHARLSLGDKN